jgi:hypothetical protein
MAQLPGSVTPTGHRVTWLNIQHQEGVLLMIFRIAPGSAPNDKKSTGLGVSTFKYHLLRLQD